MGLSAEEQDSPEQERSRQSPARAAARHVEEESFPTPGNTVSGRYTVLKVLGQGGMGVVLAAYDLKLVRRVALKLLRARASADSEGNARLLREAHALARLTHPNVVAAYDAGTLQDGRVYLVMQYVEGQTLRSWCKEQPRDWHTVVALFLQAGRGLAAAHAAGLVHRDFNLANVLIGQDGQARVTDFGLVRPAAQATPSTEPSPERLESEDNASPSLLESPVTQEGAMLGTPGYMSPEQIMGETADARSDQFSFCVSLYEALFGKRPFPGSTLNAYVRQVLSGRVPPPPSDTLVPGWAQAVVLRGLSLRPEERFPSMQALLAALEDDPAVRRRARLRAAAVVGVVLSLGVLALSGWLRNRGPSCAQLARTWLADVWDESVKARVSEALLGTGLSYAADTSERVEAALEGYAQRWVGLRTQACEAGQAQAQQIRRLSVLQVYCLERRRSQLQALTQLLSRGPDKELLIGAMQGVHTLPPLEYCTDEQALTAAVPRPEDPQVRARVEALQAQVDRLEALFAAGKYIEGAKQGEQLLPETAAAGWPPLHARALYWVAWLRLEGGIPAGAESLARQALPLAARGKDDILVVWIWNTLVWIKGRVEYRPEEALDMQLAVEAAVARANDDQARAESLQFLGLALSEHGRHEQGRDLLERSLVLNQKALGPEHPYVANTLATLGVLLRRMGEYELGLARLEQALDMRERVLGPEHPDVAAANQLLGQQLQFMGQYEQARARFERALAIRERTLGPSSSNVASSHSILGFLLMQLGEYAQARTHLERVLAFEQATPGRPRSQQVSALASLGSVLLGLGQYEQARTYLERALTVREEALRSGQPDSIGSLANPGLVLLKLGQYEQALAFLERALALAQQKLTPWHVDLAPRLSSLGTLLRETGRCEQAQAHLERALAILEKVPMPDSPLLAQVRSGLGRTRVCLGELEAAGRDLEQALAGLERALGREHPLLVNALQGLGELQRAQGKPSEAVAPLERALSLARGSERMAVQFELARALWESEQDRPRALALATEARESYRRLGHRPKLAEVSRWLAEHSHP